MEQQFSNLVVLIRLNIAIVTMLTGVGCGLLGGPPPVEDRMERLQRVRALLRVSIREMRMGTPRSYDNAHAALLLARELQPQDPRVLDGLGCIEWRKENYERAERFFKQAVTMAPRYAPGYVHLAHVAERREEYQVAIELLILATRLDPANYRARNNLAVSIRKQTIQEPNAQADRLAYYELLKAIQGSSEVDPVLNYNLNLMN